ncbi:CCA tRNA nucleotidyltransferase [Staphylococcus taiwanensis]|nr:CCA tRNA nucleotidyltransferase [Staphylococcus taiwanensis]
MGTELFLKAIPILEKIEEHGYEAYFVGGSVRDYLLNRPIHDIDITTSATPDEIESLFDKTIPIGKEHGTINVVHLGENYEVTTFRAEAEYIDHRRPSEVYFVRNLKEDLQRRDFTINAIAMDKDFKVYDYFGGQMDLEQHVIRTVGTAQERFSEDALRIIRGLRFQSQLNFTIENETFLAMQNQIADIKHLSIERIIVEFKKLITGKNVNQSYNNMLQLNLFNYVPFFKELNMSMTEITDSIRFELWLAILITKEQPQSSLTTLKMSNQEKTDIQLYHRIIVELPKITTKEALKMFVYDFGEAKILDVLSIRFILEDNHIKTGSPLVLNPQSIQEVTSQLPVKQRKDIVVNGSDLIDYFQKKSGPWLKEVLREIECAVVTQKVQNTKQEILKWVNNNVKI